MSEQAPRHLTVPEALESIRAGRIVIVVDDEDRENEGDLTMAADLVTPEAVNFMARHGRGLICLALTEDKVEALALPMMAAENRSQRGTAFTVTIDAREGITTGISARERAHTVLTAVAPEARPTDLVTPGHILPLRARRGGVLVRSGHTEAAIDLARLAGREPAGLICEIMREDGEMARLPDLEEFAALHGLGIVRIADLIQYRLERELLVHRSGEMRLRPRGAGLGAEFRACVYTTDVEDSEYLALVLGDVTPEQPTLVRVQTANLTRDALGIGGSDGGLGGPAPWLKMIEDAGSGVFLYVLPRRRRLLDDLAAAGVRVPAAAPAPERPESGALGSEVATSSTPLRDFGLGAQVLAHLGVRSLRLLTNHPRRIAGLEGYGLHVVECVPSRPPAVILPLRGEESP